MTISYPKHPRDIRVWVNRREMKNGSLGEMTTTVELSLADKLKDYLLRPVISFGHMSGIMVELMGKKKISIDFGEYTERIELADPGDKLSSAQAMTLLEDLVAEIKGGEVSGPDRKKSATQKIVVQFPKSPTH